MHKTMDIKKAWDKHRVPKPFATAVISYGDPIYIPRSLTEEEFEKYRLVVEEAMLSNRSRAISEVERLTFKKS